MTLLFTFLNKEGSTNSSCQFHKQTEVFNWIMKWTNQHFHILAGIYWAISFNNICEGGEAGVVTGSSVSLLVATVLISVFFFSIIQMGVCLLMFQTWPPTIPHWFKGKAQRKDWSPVFNKPQWSWNGRAAWWFKKLTNMSVLSRLSK